jgi:dihydroxyacetone kinase-like predicted kinase
MTSLATLGAEDLRTVMGRYRDVLRLHQGDINLLNVYPVPDGDTGTNMALTLEAVMTELEEVPAGSGLAAVCRAIGHGSLMGARGNSGVILSQLLPMPWTTPRSWPGAPWSSRWRGRS